MAKYKRYPDDPYILTRIFDRLDATGMGLGAMLAKAGVNRGWVRDMRRRDKPDAHPRHAVLLRMADALDVPPSYLVKENLTVKQSAPAKPTTNVEMGVLRPLPADGARDVPVYESAMGGDGALIIRWEPVDYIPRPEPLVTAPKGFGIYVVGDSMEPVFEQGHLLLVHPGRPPHNGADVLIILKSDTGEHAAMVKRLVSMAPNFITVRQFNPKRDFKIDRKSIDGIYQVVGVHYRR